jgi:hypothetical protein
LIGVGGFLDGFKSLGFEVLPFIRKFRDTFKSFAFLSFKSLEITGLLASQGGPFIRDGRKLACGIQAAAKTSISVNRFIGLFHYRRPARN